MLIQTIGWSSKTIKPISTTVTVKVKPVGKNGPIFLVSLVPYEEINTGDGGGGPPDPLYYISMHHALTKQNSSYSLHEFS